MRRASLFLVTALSALLFAAPGYTQSAPKVVGEFRDWVALTLKDQTGDVCYMSSSPQKWTSVPSGVNRGDIYILVTHRPGAKVRDEVSVYTGYAYQKESETVVSIDGQDFSMFTHDDTAWARDAASDSAMVKAMIRGNTMVIRGTSNRGTVTTDTYSLSGFTAAHNAINKACRIR
jgi:hypothetical protein